MLKWVLLAAAALALGKLASDLGRVVESSDERIAARDE